MIKCTFAAKMKRFLLAVAGFVFIAVACNQSADNTKIANIMKDSAKYTTIKWQDSAIDFGTKKMGEVVNITFNCTNTGNKPLYLYEVRPGCGCTVVDYTKTPIEPGKQGMVEAKFDTKKSHVGNVNKSVYVNANATNVSSPYLHFFGVIAEANSSVKK